jgi:hypothetical protein
VAGPATPVGTILAVRWPNKGWSLPVLPYHGELAALEQAQLRVEAARARHGWRPISRALTSQFNKTDRSRVQSFRRVALLPASSAAFARRGWRGPGAASASRLKVLLLYRFHRLRRAARLLANSCFRQRAAPSQRRAAASTAQHPSPARSAPLALPTPGPARILLAPGRPRRLRAEPEAPPPALSFTELLCDPAEPRAGPAGLPLAVISKPSYYYDTIIRYYDSVITVS